MATFGYIAVDKTGKEKKGSLDVESEDLLRVELKKQGLTILEISKQNLLTRDLNIEIGGNPTARDLSIFCRQFVSMYRAGVSILETIHLLTDQTENKKLAKAAREVQAKIEKGESLSDSLTEFPKIFPKLMVTTIAAGEASGSLDIAFDRMATHFEKSSKTQALIKKAMIYPIVVAVVALAVVIVMLVKIIPMYTEMFDQLGTELPAITVAVVNASNFLVDFWYILIPLVVVLIWGIRYFLQTPAGQLTIGRMAIKIPMFKNFSVKTASASLARTLSTLLAAGVPLVEAVGISGNTMSNVLFKNALQDAKEEIIRGIPLSSPIEDSGLFPPMVSHMLRIGEESGSTEEMLDKLAEYYEEEVEIATESLMAAMEPMIIIVLAVIVGVLIAAVMAPMLSMYSGLDAL
jgi:type IV pilus assembly protein PilC